MLSIQHLNKSYGGIKATVDLCLELPKGQLHAIIGPNGAGKTTLINQITGTIASDSGEIVLDQHNITSLKPHQRACLGLGRSYQITSIFMPMTLLENMALAIQAQQGHAFRFWSPVLKQAELRDAAMQSLEEVGMHKKAHLLASALSHGEHRQLEMALTLATKPTVLLLDEPMAGFSSEENQRMILFIEKLKTTHTILLVEHDMNAVFQLADKISVLVNGQIIASDIPELIRQNSDVQTAYLGTPATAI